MLTGLFSTNAICFAQQQIHQSDKSPSTNVFLGWPHSLLAPLLTVMFSPPEDMGPAVLIVAAHLQPHVEDGVHAEDVGCVETHPLRPGHLL